MSTLLRFSRRSFVAGALAAPLMLHAKSEIPIGLELYSVRDDLKADPMATLAYIGKMGYQCVEFYAPYFDWTADYARQIRAQLDASNLKCYSTHNSLTSFQPANLGKAMELNSILGSRYIVCAHPGEMKTVDDWRKVADTLTSGNEKMAASGIHAGYHNHDLEWKPVDGKIPMQILASSTPKSVMLQLDVGTCLEAGANPVEWIRSNPGRIRSMHLKDWSPEKGYKVLFGEGVAPWRELFAAAQSVGGAEFYLIEQEGSRFSEKETAEKCLANYKHLTNT